MSATGRTWMRFSLLVIVLAGTFGLLKARNREEILPAQKSLGSFPSFLGGWQGRNLPIDDETQVVLGPGDFLSRDYFNSTEGQIVNLFIAFFPSQRQGDTIHSPKNCLPGAGWRPIESARLWIDASAGRRVKVNRFLLEKDSDKALVLYWYQAHGRVTASEYAAKYHLVVDSIVMNRSDGTLIRITAMVKRSEDFSEAENRAVDFAKLIFPVLNDYIPE